MRPSRDAVLGCIVGGAIGDAIGGVRERGNLSISDDTQLTLATCESIAKRGRVDPESVASVFTEWFRRGALSGVGSSTLEALRDLDAGNHWALSGAAGEMSAGNGAAMRIAPLAFLLNPDDEQDRVTIRDVCRITHRNDEAYLGALAVLQAIRSSEWPVDIFDVLVSVLPDSRMRDRFSEFAGLPEATTFDEIIERFGSSGYVVETVPLALAAARKIPARGFSRTLRELTDLGGDTDTIGSIAGQVAGSHLGFLALAAELKDLPPVRAILPLAEAYATAIGGRV